MVEVGLALIEPFVNQTLTGAVSAGPGAVIPVASTEYMYPGAMVVVGWQAADAEVATVIAVPSDTTFTANLNNNHAKGETVFGCTFATQQPTDPIFTQAEIIDYIAQAQNEFLAKVPLILELFPNQLLTLGQQIYQNPGSAIETERVAIQSTPVSTTFNIASISRSGNVVTCVLSSTANTDNWTAGLPILVLGVTDNSYNSALNLPFTLTSVSTDGLTLQWSQVGVNSSSSGGQVMRPILTRLYESSQEQIAMNNPYWQTSALSQAPTAWWEDRAGTYGFGVSPIPQAGYYVELLCSVRGSESLGLLDGFLIPDIMVPAVKFKTLQFAWSKDGVQRSATRAAFFGKRFDFWVMLCDRYLRNSGMLLKGAK